MRIVYCTCPRDRSAEIARTLVERRLVACVTVIPGVRSVFRWDGQVQEEAEDLLMMKTSEEAVIQLLMALPDLHPYDVPEILTVEVAEGHPPYVDWVEDQTRKPPGPGA